MARSLKEIEKIAEEQSKEKLFSSRWFELSKLLDEDKIFECACCGQMCSYNDLCWCSDLEGDGIQCESCYEEEMGDDL